jgi:hypothetical protein
VYFIILLPDVITFKGLLRLSTKVDQHGAICDEFMGHNASSVHGSLKADSHIACRAHAVPLPCRAEEGLECVFPI